MWKLDKEELWFIIWCYNNYVNSFFEEHEEGMYPVNIYEFYNNEMQEQEIYQYYLQYLWEDFAYIGIDNKDNIIEDFNIWEKGTHREIIWEWFDKRVIGKTGKKGIGANYF